MADSLIIALPSLVEADQHATHWWRAIDGVITASGADDGWLAQPGLTGPMGPRLIALAPVAAARLVFAEPGSGTATVRQAQAVARVAAVEQSLGERSTLHAATAVVDGAAGTTIVTALVANSTMLEWLDWARSQGVELHHIVPAALLLLPLGEQWLAATIGAEPVIGRHGLVMPNEPALAQAIVGGDDVAELAAESVTAAIAALGEQPLPLPLDLRSGRFARRRRLVIDRDRIAELVALAAIIPLLIALWSIVSIVRLEQSSDRLDAQTLRLAQAAAGRPLTIETAEAALAERAGQAAGGLSAPLAALYQQLQTSSSVSSTRIGYTGDGTLAVTLAAPRAEDVNPLLVALQRDRYRITAVPRQASDGRAMVDVTVRSAP